jgi:hypothetical protein
MIINGEIVEFRWERRERNRFSKEEELETYSKEMRRIMKKDKKKMKFRRPKQEEVNNE